jgi:Zn-dependent protease with chaperone function
MNYVHRTWITTALTITSCLNGHLPPVEPSEPQKVLSNYESIKRNVLDFVLFEHLGYKGVATEVEQFVRTIQEKMGMAEYNIEIRSMSNAIIKSVGHMNAFVIPSFRPRTGLHYLFISEAWFTTLSTAEKTALIGHELIHIKNNHITQKLLLNLGTLCSSVMLDKMITNKITNSPYDPKVKLAFQHIASASRLMAQLTINSAFSRSCEKECDIQSARMLSCAEGGVQLWDTVINHTQDPESRFRLKRVLNTVLSPFTQLSHILMATHPKLEDRKAYMERLASEQKNDIRQTAEKE